jgi:hypothetical protein
MTHITAGVFGGVTRLVSIDMLSAEQRAKLVGASQKARPHEEYRVQFAALAQRRLELQQARGGAGRPGSAPLSFGRL